MLALLLALSASPEELEVVLISVTYGNVQLQKYDVTQIATIAVQMICVLMAAVSP